MRVGTHVGYGVALATTSLFRFPALCIGKVTSILLALHVVLYSST